MFRSTQDPPCCELDDDGYASDIPHAIELIFAREPRAWRCMSCGAQLRPPA